MKVTPIPVGMLSANCYLLSDGGPACAIIDPGAQPDKLRRALELDRQTPSLILLTHGHYDHMGAVNQLKEWYPEAQVLIHEADAEMLADPTKNFSIEISGEGYSTKADRLLTDNEVILFGERGIRVIHTPGHSKGSVCYLVGKMIFCGDTVFAQGIGRTDLYGGSYPEISKSVKKLAEMEGDYVLNPGHGPATTLQKERLQNPYMRLDYDDLL